MKNKEKAQAIATQRALLLAPLLSDDLDKGELKLRKERICRETGLSERTIRRYLNEYRTKGFDGLIPKPRVHGPSGVLPPEIVEEAIRLRREVPSRSVAEIIRILEWEKIILPGTVKRSTLQEKLTGKRLQRKAYGALCLRGLATRRFQSEAAISSGTRTSSTAVISPLDREANPNRSIWWPSSMMPRDWCSMPNSTPA